MSRFTRNFIFEELNTLCDALGRVPTKKEFMDYSESRYACISIFGSYNNMLIAAGKVPNRIINKKKDQIITEEALTPVTINVETEKRSTKRLSNDEIIQDICRCAVEHPEIKSPIKLLKTFGKHGMETYRRHIGNTPKLMPIIQQARQAAINKVIYMKRYPIKYNPSTVFLKWARKRVE